MKKTILAGLLAVTATGCGGPDETVNEATDVNVAEVPNLAAEAPVNATVEPSPDAMGAQVPAPGPAAPPPAAIAPVAPEREKGRAIAAPPPQRPPAPTTAAPGPPETDCAPEHRAAGHC